MLKAEGNCKVSDPIYKDRFKHIPELVRLGGNADIIEHTAFIQGVSELSGASIMASDLRAGAALVIAALTIKGTTEILRIYHIDRGYENFEQKLTTIGANIKRIKTDLI